MIEPVCFNCGKHPREIPEYVAYAAQNETSPDDFVRREEGTYNRDNGHFACTECYIAIGMPSSPNGWKAP